ncbi:unnamed protein product [Pedinophyceae sp. YPF-701]|nr:unnamed protein product [Pedinophyceae sp. YPF-701]
MAGAIALPEDPLFPGPAARVLGAVDGNVRLSHLEKEIEAVRTRRRKVEGAPAESFSSAAMLAQALRREAAERDPKRAEEVHQRVIREAQRAERAVLDVLHRLTPRSAATATRFNAAAEAHRQAARDALPAYLAELQQWESDQATRASATAGLSAMEHVRHVSQAKRAAQQQLWQSVADLQDAINESMDVDAGLAAGQQQLNELLVQVAALSQQTRTSNAPSTVAEVAQAVARLQAARTTVPDAQPPARKPPHRAEAGGSVAHNARAPDAAATPPADQRPAAAPSSGGPSSGSRSGPSDRYAASDGNLLDESSNSVREGEHPEACDSPRMRDSDGAGRRESAGSAAGVSADGLPPLWSGARPAGGPAAHSVESLSHSGVGRIQMQIERQLAGHAGAAAASASHSGLLSDLTAGATRVEDSAARSSAVSLSVSKTSLDMSSVLPEGGPARAPAAPPEARSRTPQSAAAAAALAQPPDDSVLGSGGVEVARRRMRIASVGPDSSSNSGHEDVMRVSVGSVVGGDADGAAGKDDLDRQARQVRRAARDADAAEREAAAALAGAGGGSDGEDPGMSQESWPESVDLGAGVSSTGAWAGAAAIKDRDAHAEEMRRRREEVRRELEADAARQEAEAMGMAEAVVQPRRTSEALGSPDSAEAPNARESLGAHLAEALQREEEVQDVPESPGEEGEEGGSGDSFAFPERGSSPPENRPAREQRSQVAPAVARVGAVEQAGTMGRVGGLNLTMPKQPPVHRRTKSAPRVVEVPPDQFGKPGYPAVTIDRSRRSSRALDADAGSPKRARSPLGSRQTSMSDLNRSMQSQRSAGSSATSPAQSIHAASPTGRHVSFVDSPPAAERSDTWRGGWGSGASSGASSGRSTGAKERPKSASTVPAASLFGLARSGGFLGEGGALGAKQVGISWGAGLAQEADADELESALLAGLGAGPRGGAGRARDDPESPPSEGEVRLSGGSRPSSGAVGSGPRRNLGGGMPPKTTSDVFAREGVRMGKVQGIVSAAVGQQRGAAGARATSAAAGASAARGGRGMGMGLGTGEMGSDALGLDDGDEFDF